MAYVTDGGLALPPIPRRRKIPVYHPPRNTSGYPIGGVPPGLGGTDSVDPGGHINNSPGMDYAGLIENDPLFSQYRINSAAQGIADKASRDAALHRALIQFGSVPDANSLHSLGFDTDVDAQTRALAAANTTAGLSTTARIGQAHTDAVSRIKQVLAARGAAHSGESGYQVGREQQAFTTAGYDSTQKLLDYVGGFQAAYAASERQRQADLFAARTDAANRQASYPWNLPPAPGSSSPAAPPPGPSSYPIGGTPPGLRPAAPPRRRRATRPRFGTGTQVGAL